MADLETGRIRQLDSTIAGHSFVGVVEADQLLWVTPAIGAFVVTDTLGHVVRRHEVPPSVAVSKPSAMLERGRNTVLISGTRAATGERFLYRLDLTSGEWQEWGSLGSPPGFALLARDAEGYVYCATGDGLTEIWRLVPGRGRGTLYATLPFHCYLGGVSMTPDADRLVCNVTTQDSDAWLLEWGPAGQ